MSKVLFFALLVIFSIPTFSQINQGNTFPSSGNVGIGTTSPTSQLHLESNNALAFRIGIASSSWAQLAIAKNNGNFSTLAQSGDVVLRTSAGNGNFLITNTGFNSTVFATGGFGNERERMVITVDGNVGIGITNPTDKFEVNGRIHAKSVKVDLDNWPDYVFEKGYHLKSLHETENYIKSNGHLEGVPSREEIITDGLDLGAMDKILLEKVEELTLYLIEKDDQIYQIQEDNKVLIGKLEALVIEFDQIKQKLN